MTKHPKFLASLLFINGLFFSCGKSDHQANLQNNANEAINRAKGTTSPTLAQDFCFIQDELKNAPLLSRIHFRPLTGDEGIAELDSFLITPTKTVIGYDKTDQNNKNIFSWSKDSLKINNSLDIEKDSDLSKHKNLFSQFLAKNENDQFAPTQSISLHSTSPFKNQDETLTAYPCHSFGVDLEKVEKISSLEFSLRVGKEMNLAMHALSPNTYMDTLFNVEQLMWPVSPVQKKEIAEDFLADKSWCNLKKINEKVNRLDILTFSNNIMAHNAFHFSISKDEFELPYPILFLTPETTPNLYAYDLQENFNLKLKETRIVGPSNLEPSIPLNEISLIQDSDGKMTLINLQNDKNYVVYQNMFFNCEDESLIERLKHVGEHFKKIKLTQQEAIEKASQK
jgi:hypothetical protein